MNIIKDKNSLRDFRHDNHDKKISFVPTMGALHEGHMALVREGINRAEICLPYIFINPRQFAEGEDLSSYPKTLDNDLALLKNAGIKNVYVPNVQEIYPDGFQTIINVTEISKPLEGESRPHFFQGVCTIVCKMILQAMPDIVMMGEKDYQQLQVVKRMVKDLDIPSEIIGMTTVRDNDGLALSSRNSYLNQDEHAIAIYLNQILKKLALNILDEGQAKKELLAAGFNKIDYITKRNGETFGTDSPNRVLAAAWIGKTRLIDNMAIE